MKSGIYKITNEKTGKFYIGSAKDIEWRWFEHKRDLRLKSHCNPKLQHSWDFYGGDKFTFTILEEVEPEKDKLLIREQYYLDTFKPYMREIGYNICPTAFGGDNITHNPNKEAFLEKMSEICSGENNPMFGRKHSEETLKLQRNKASGRFSLEWFVNRYGKREGKNKYEDRRKMLANRNINYSFSSPQKGKKKSPMSEESKKRITKTKIKLKNIRDNIIQDILSGKHTVLKIATQYNINVEVVKYYKRKIKQEPTP